jgi:tellurite resistance protein
MIIYGSRGITRTRAKGVFHCPQCTTKVNYKHKRVTRWFTLYFIPTFPTGTAAEYVECQKCQGTFDVGAISYDPEVEREKFEAAYLSGMKRVMVQVMLADGEIQPAEVQLLRGIYKNVANRVLGQQEIDAEVDALRAQKADPFFYLGNLGEMLNEDGKVRVLRAAVLVATADGSLQASEQQLLAKIARALSLGESKFRQVVNEVLGQPQPQ